MVDLIYDVQNLKCQYKRSPLPVLHIDNLPVEKGKIYFMVGASGVGKSTLLETMGIMTNTLKTAGDSVFKFYDDGEIDIPGLWQGKEKRLARFRRQHLSFIFQSTNLFRNLNAYQNASISQVLQGYALHEANLRARQILQEIFEEDIWKHIVAGKAVKAMSGGQKQRLAFVRALGGDFSVLLADEPTGNLDHYNARNLVKFLTDFLRNRGKTAIIVSHDIDLATHFGDEIILIRKVKRQDGGEQKFYGLIDEDSVYRRKENTGEQWLNGSKAYTTQNLNLHLQEKIRESSQ